MKYTVTLKILARTYTSQGETVLEALEGIKPQGVVKAMGILTVTKGEEKREKILAARNLARLFSESRLMREVALKNTSLLFQGF